MSLKHSKGPGSKYFRFYWPYMDSVTLFLTQSKNLKPTSTLRAIQKQATDHIWPLLAIVSTPETREVCWLLPYSVSEGTTKY